MITIDLCLSDLPNDACRRSVKNNKIYVNLVLSARREKDNFGNTHTIYVSQSKEQRENHEQKVYVGSGKETVYDGSTLPAANPYNNPTPVPVIDTENEIYNIAPVATPTDENDLPF
jgi:hypothetical protein